MTNVLSIVLHLMKETKAFFSFSADFEPSQTQKVMHTVYMTWNR
jgi:hypothetical protein